MDNDKMKNKDRIIKKIVFNVPMKTQTPLRISSGIDDGITDILVLKDKNGKAFIPGTSVAGVLRSRINSIYDDKAEEKLFGSVETENGNQSMVNISDIVLENAEVINRDGIKIDPVTGVSVEGAKYDFEAIDRGAEGTLKIEITVRKNDLIDENMPIISYKHNDFATDGDIYGEMAATLADILTTGINVGALTTKGFGRIKSIEPVPFYIFDFAKDDEAGKWLCYLDGKYENKPEYTGSPNEEILTEKDFIMKMNFALKSTLIIRDYDAAEQNESEDKIMAVQMKSGEDFVIPGTSIKGALKSRAYNILMQLKDNDEKTANDFLDSFMGREKGKNGEADNGAKSSLYVDEVYIKPSQVKLMKQTRNRIDRFTGGTVESNLFTDEPIYQVEETLPSVFMKISIKDCKEQQAGLMLLLLKDLWLGNLAIGGNKAIGRGVLCGRKCTIDYNGNSFVIEDNGKFTVKGDMNILENYVQKLVNGD